MTPDVLAAEDLLVGLLEVVDDGADPVAQQFEVEVALGPDHAHAVDPAEVGHRPAGGDHGLGGDAVPEVGRPADHVPLDEGDVHPQAGGVGGRLVAGRAATDDDESHGARLRRSDRAPHCEGSSRARRWPRRRPCHHLASRYHSISTGLHWRSPHRKRRQRPLDWCLRMPRRNVMCAMDPRRQCTKQHERRRRAARRSAPSPDHQPAAGGPGRRRRRRAHRPRSSAPATSGRSLDPAQFADGSCVAFAPTAGDRDETVFLDAGHGGIDPGGVGTTESGATIDEATETLPVELEVMDLLRAKGFRVVVSRTTDDTVLRLSPADQSGNELSLTGSHDDVAARDICANDAHAQVLVGIYYDAGASSENAGSLTAYDAARPFAAANLRLATPGPARCGGGHGCPGLGHPRRRGPARREPGLVRGRSRGRRHRRRSRRLPAPAAPGPGSPGFFTTPSQMPGAVIEPLYLTDPYEGSIADLRRGQQVIAQGIASASRAVPGPQESGSGMHRHDVRLTRTTAPPSRRTGAHPRAAGAAGPFRSAGPALVASGTSTRRPVVTS